MLSVPAYEHQAHGTVGGKEDRCVEADLQSALRLVGDLHTDPWQGSQQNPL